MKWGQLVRNDKPGESKEWLDLFPAWRLSSWTARLDLNFKLYSCLKTYQILPWLLLPRWPPAHCAFSSLILIVVPSLYSHPWLNEVVLRRKTKMCQIGRDRSQRGSKCRSNQLDIHSNVTHHEEEDWKVKGTHHIVQHIRFHLRANTSSPNKVEEYGSG